MAPRWYLAAIAQVAALLAEQYVEALLEPSPPRARAIVRDVVQGGMTVEEAYLDVLTPALHEIGRRWEAGEISVAHEHLATEVTSALVSELAERIRTPTTSGRLAVVSCTPGERHCVGGQMLSALLDGADWEVLYLGGSLPAADIAGLVDAERPDALALSATCASELAAAEALIELVRSLSEPPLILVGGQAFAGEDAARGIGADAFAADPVAGRDLLDRLPRSE